MIVKLSFFAFYDLRFYKKHIYWVATKSGILEKPGIWQFKLKNLEEIGQKPVATQAHQLKSLLF